MFVELATEHLLSALAQEVIAATVRHIADRTLSVAPTRTVPEARGTPQPTWHAVASSTVVSDTPGRARIQVRGLRGNPARAAAVVQRLRRLHGVHSAQANPVTGTVLVQYEPNRLSLGGIRSALDAAPSVNAALARR